MKRIIIIGAGPTGLAAAYRFKELGYENFMVYERNSYVGGLCASFRDEEGFTWDLGGHVIFSHYAYFDKLLKRLLGHNFLTHERKAWIRTMNRWIPYPFQNNIKYLPKGIMLECLKGLNESTGKDKKSSNFKEWIINNLGNGIAKHFMLPYNFKVWAYPPHLLSTDWVGERVSNIEKILKSDKTKNSWGPNAIFKYPLYGGTGEIFRKLALVLNDKIKLNSEIIRINSKKRKVYLSNGKEDTYDILINTSPIDKFLSLFQEYKWDLLNISSCLKHNGVFVVGLGIDKPCPSDKCWMYFPENKSPFFRITYLSNYSPNNVPNHKKHYSLLCETSYSKYKKENKTEIIEKTIQGLINSGIINKTDRKFIISKFLFDIDYAYPVPTLKRDEVLRKIQSELGEMDIYSRGRFGAWKYEIGNTDHSVMQGKEIVDKILKTTKERIWR